jgi:hypothetical protein
MRLLHQLSAASLGAALLCLPSSSPTVRAQTKGLSLPLHLTAVAQDLDRGLSTQIRITVDRWSTDAVRDKLLNVLMNQGAEKLLSALQDAPKVGTIGTPTSLAWDLHYARETPGEDGGNRIVLGTDRPIAFSEQWNASRTLEYPFTVVELHLNDDAEGEGTMSYATKVIPDKENKSIVLENWGTQRVRLTQVKREH